MLQVSMRRLFQLLCLTMIAGLLTVGLWPFDFTPKNKVNWLPDQNGVHFVWYGQAYSTSSWQLQPHSDQSFTIELWVRPDEIISRTTGAVLFLYDPTRYENFRIQQHASEFEVRGLVRDESGQISIREFAIGGKFRRNPEPVLTVTSGPAGTAIYLDGILEKSSPLSFMPENLHGRFILGHSATARGPWAGSILGLAIYARVLTPEEITEHAQSWRLGTGARFGLDPDIRVLYTFSERGGNMIHSRISSAPDIVIPRQFAFVRRTILGHAFSFRSLDISDMIVNILGFIPPGLLFFFYLSRFTGLRPLNAVLLASVLGTLISFGIELGQLYLPSRDSSLVDLLTNALGSVIGSAFGWKYESPIARVLDSAFPASDPSQSS